MAKTTRQTAPKQKKAALYIRVSTLYQVDRDSLPMQRKELTAYASLMLGIEETEVFEDAGYSGKNVDRPAFQYMMQRVRKGEFSHILVWKIDRISRNLLDFAEMYQELQHLKVTFVSKNEQFDTSTAIGEAMLKIILVFAELERNMTAERVTAAMISRASSGLWNGGRIPYGYSYNKEKKEFSIVDEEANILHKMKADYLDSRSLIHVVKMLNSMHERPRSGKDWTPTGVWGLLSNPFHAGIYRYNRFKGTIGRTINDESEWVMVYDHHPAIFTVEEHEKLRSILFAGARNRNLPGVTKHGKYVHVFSGIAFCGKCGCMLHSTPGRLHADGYRSSNYSCPRHRRSKDCDNPTMSDTQIGEFVINYILNMLRSKDSFSKMKGIDDLERRLLSGSTFSGIEHIETAGLSEFYNLLSRFEKDTSYKFTLKPPKRRKVPADPEIASVRRQIEKEERALRRLQDLYLYSEHSMSEKDYIVQRTRITNIIQELRVKLGMMRSDPDSGLSDEEFVRQASHLLIAKELKGRDYIYYKNLARDVSPDVLKAYMDVILDSVRTSDGHVSAITFKNGLTHRFVYKQ